MSPSNAFARIVADAARPDPSVPHTVAMDRRLELLAETGAKVIGTHNGLPVVQAPSGRRMVLTTLGRLERI